MIVVAINLFSNPFLLSLANAYTVGRMFCQPLISKLKKLLNSYKDYTTQCIQPSYLDSTITSITKIVLYSVLLFFYHAMYECSSNLGEFLVSIMLAEAALYCLPYYTLFSLTCLTYVACVYDFNVYQTINGVIGIIGGQLLFVSALNCCSKNTADILLNGNLIHNTKLFLRHLQSLLTDKYIQARTHLIESLYSAPSQLAQGALKISFLYKIVCAVEFTHKDVLAYMQDRRHLIQHHAMRSGSIKRNASNTATHYTANKLNQEISQKSTRNMRK